MSPKVHSVSEVGVHVRERRKALDYTQTEVANLCGTVTRFISDLENGKAVTVLEALGLDLVVEIRGGSQ